MAHALQDAYTAYKDIFGETEPREPIDPNPWHVAASLFAGPSPSLSARLMRTVRDFVDDAEEPGTDRAWRATADEPPTGAEPMTETLTFDPRFAKSFKGREEFNCAFDDACNEMAATLLAQTMETDGTRSSLELERVVYRCGAVIRVDKDHVVVELSMVATLEWTS